MPRVDDNIRIGEDAACAYPSLLDANSITVDNKITGYMYRKDGSETMISKYSLDEYERIQKLYENLTESFSERTVDVDVENGQIYYHFWQLQHLILNYSKSKRRQTKLR